MPANLPDSAIKIPILPYFIQPISFSTMLYWYIFIIITCSSFQFIDFVFPSNFSSFGVKFLPFSFILHWDSSRKIFRIFNIFQEPWLWNTPQWLFLENFAEYVISHVSKGSQVNANTVKKLIQSPNIYTSYPLFKC